MLQGPYSLYGRIFHKICFGVPIASFLVLLTGFTSDIRRDSGVDRQHSVHRKKAPFSFPFVMGTLSGLRQGLILGYFMLVLTRNKLFIHIFLLDHVPTLLVVQGKLFGPLEGGEFLLLLKI